MKRLLLLALLAGLGISLTFISGCDGGKDDKSTGPGTGNPIDSTYVTGLFGGDDLFGTPYESYVLSFALLDSIPGGATPKSTGGFKGLQDGDEEVAITAVGSYSYSNGWHIFQFEATVIDLVTYDTIDVVGIDSVQVLEDGQPVQYPTLWTQMDGLKARTHADLDDRSGYSHGDMHHLVDFSIDTVAGETVITIDGTVHDTLSASGGDDVSWCDIDLTLDQAVINLQVYADNQEGDCPLSGYVTAAVSLEVLCVGEGQGSLDSLSISGTWTITATVNDNNTVTITYSDGTTVWTITESCDGSGSVERSSPFIWL